MFWKIFNDSLGIKDLVNKALKSFKDTKGSLDFTVNIDPSYMERFVRYLIDNPDCGYFIVAFYEEDELIGVCLLSEGSTWYDPKRTFLNEECTVSFKKGFGFARHVVDMMETLAKERGHKFIVTSTANPPVAKMLENTYTKKGFSYYKTFYKEVN